jgi:hypothetical protein
MDRLTVRRSDGRVAIANNDGATPLEQTMKIPLVLSRLAAYEDTGLEPEDLTRVFNEEAILKLAGQVLGATPDRIRELAQADREDGRRM